MKKLVDDEDENEEKFCLRSSLNWWNIYIVHKDKYL